MTSVPRVQWPVTLQQIESITSVPALESIRARLWTIRAADFNMEIVDVALDYDIPTMSRRVVTTFNSGELGTARICRVHSDDLVDSDHLGGMYLEFTAKEDVDNVRSYYTEQYIKLYEAAGERIDQIRQLNRGFTSNDLHR